MSTWKKMAEAFGKAANRPGATSGGRDIVYNSKTWKDRPGDVQPRYDDTPEQRAMKDGWQQGRDEYYAARELAAEKGLDRNDPKTLEEMADEISDRESDARLEKEFDEGFNSAIKRRKQDVKDWYGKDFPRDKVDEGADTFEEDLWRVIGELRDKGMSGTDILNVLKGTNR